MHEEIKSSLTEWFNRLFQNMGIRAGVADRIDHLTVLILIVLIAFVAGALCRFLLIGVIEKIVRRARFKWHDLLFEKNLMKKASNIVPAILIASMIPLAFPENSRILLLLQKFCACYVLVVVILLLNGMAKFGFEVLNQREEWKDRPLKGLLQVIQIILYSVCIILIISIFLNIPVGNMLTGLGAMAAVLTLVFKDTILGLVSGVLLSANKMLKTGDWITVPGTNADGFVTEVSLHTVKVRNFDNTVTMLPPTVLTNSSFQNWRNMFESGGRRIKRSIDIDISTVKFCDRALLDKLREIDLLRDYIDERTEQFRHYNREHRINEKSPVNGHRLTNIGLFRNYLLIYLKSLPDINTELFTLVRHLEPTDKGIPIELYFFSSRKDWVSYERIQADVFDHVMAIVPEFELRVFQSPSGSDVRELKNALGSPPKEEAAS